MLHAGKVLSYVYPIGYWILVYPIGKCVDPNYYDFNFVLFRY